MASQTPARGTAADDGATVAPPKSYGQPRASRVARWSSRTISRPVESTAALVGLLALAAVAFESHVLHGGYYLDDWLALELSHHLGGGSVWDGMGRQWDYSGFRPVSSIYRALVWESPLGTHLRANLAAAALAAVGMSLLLFAVLRSLRFSRLDAGAIAALVLVCPLASSTRMWISASTASVNIAIYLVGLLLAIHGLRAESRRAQVCWHAAATTVFFASVLFAETTAGIVVATSLLYLLMRGFRAALPRALVDTTLAAVGVVWISEHDDLTPRSAKSASALWSRVGSMANDVPTVFARVVDPFSGSGWLALLALGLLAAGAVAWWLLPRRSQERDQIGRWLVVAPAGLVVALAGWVIYLPADNYYRPDQAGIGNRINALASIGLILVVYAAVRIGATLLARRGQRPSMLATALTVAVTLVLLLGYVHDTRAQAGVWNRAFASETATLSFVRSSLPHPPPNSMIYVVRQPQFDTPEIPIFVAWDFRPALRFAYGDAPRNLSAWAVPWSVPFHCEAGVVYPLQWGWNKAEGAPYGRVWMIDVATRQVWRITDKASCLAVTAAVAALPQAPWVLNVPNGYQ